jgi:hypothetical protein
LATIYHQIHGWHVVTKGSTLNGPPYWILEIQNIKLLQYDQIINATYNVSQKQVWMRYQFKSEMYK